MVAAWLVSMVAMWVCVDDRWQRHGVVSMVAAWVWVNDQWWRGSGSMVLGWSVMVG